MMVDLFMAPDLILIVILGQDHAMGLLRAQFGGLMNQKWICQIFQLIKKSLILNLMRQLIY